MFNKCYLDGIGETLGSDIKKFETCYPFSPSHSSEIPALALFVSKLDHDNKI